MRARARQRSVACACVQISMLAQAEKAVRARAGRAHHSVRESARAYVRVSATLCSQASATRLRTA
eukprot:1793599-Pleurochrysis_carterae.AAC.1